ncbi:hypothetical protein BZARG_67 [Bizionia argentinensis JUB59]|uniref:Uncharacterized protein n=1 Tax=Bizionia argentinensis JUB59 TaxID=1046627 RepID=G2E956_9FLAO|nr:hypothetical protein [Bizionia argentinensis]EGV44859.1 hypothetical protein BZARG_67 [Bizionia argentinensis JUB59]
MQGQGYAKDSLQIKVYTQITYKNKEAKDIKLLKVFCDYCSDAQTTSMGNAALRRSYDERYYPENILVNGKKKLAIIIRIAKDDFLGIDTETINEKSP